MVIFNLIKSIIVLILFVIVLLFLAYFVGKFSVFILYILGLDKIAEQVNQKLIDYENRLKKAFNKVKED